ncbi:hypothetical protein [Streptomyces sp. NPDC101237]|uniref:hypothetical protein n=1 Tax=Streptomyces sp. NPDC101237 TaxID=3366139 RepID=UPI003827DEDC
MEYVVQVMHEDESPRYQTYCLALYESWDEGAIGFEFQRDLRDPSDPRAWNPPVYCVVNGAHDASYGGVRRVNWIGGSVEMEFTPESALELGIAGEIVKLAFAGNIRDVESIKRGLVRIFSYGPPDQRPELIGFDTPAVGS